MNDRIAIFCDFDGTVCPRDVGDDFFREFGSARGEEAFLDRRAGLITGREALEENCRCVHVDRGRFVRWLSRFDLDPFFKDFLDFSHNRDIQVVILSDGLDLYIRELLDRDGLHDVPFIATGARLIGRRIEPEFPYHNRLGCQECAHCKTWHLRAKREEGYFTVYVGDGSSDQCPCENADMVFAKGRLRDYCLNRGIRHFRYANFRDVEMILTETLQRRRMPA